MSKLMRGIYLEMSLCKIICSCRQRPNLRIPGGIDSFVAAIQWHAVEGLKAYIFARCPAHVVSEVDFFGIDFSPKFFCAS
jgi:hypothetical protein